MERKDALTKILTIAGTLCIWFPVVAPIVLSIARLIADGIFRFDFLMPAELFPLVVIGGALLIWAATRARKRRKFIIGGLSAAVGMLLATQGLALLTGMASGEAEATGWRLALAVAGLVLYCLAVVVTGVGGALLLRDLYAEPKEG